MITLGNKGDRGGTDAADYTGNFLLVEAGANVSFDTQSCAGGVLADDTQITVNTATYDGSDPFITTLGINGGGPLPVGKYRLFVCGTTSVENLAGDELNEGVFDSTLDFTVSASTPTPTSTPEPTPTPDPAPSNLPSTGFAHGRVTTLLVQPAANFYIETSMMLEIPSLDGSMSIVGIPQSESSWDVIWLGSNAGYLAGSAFPTWEGNTVITGHVWDALDQPGAFLRVENAEIWRSNSD